MLTRTVRQQSKGVLLEVTMIKKVVRKRSLPGFSEVKENLAYWLSKTPDERIAEVDRLRRQYDGSSTRLQRSARIVQRSRS
jgi:hypothetical protein